MVSGFKISVLQYTLTHCQYDLILVSHPYFRKKCPSCREDNLSELTSRLCFKSWQKDTTTTLVVEPCRRGSTLIEPWPLFHSFSTEWWIHNAMNIHGLPSQKHLAMVDFPFREQEITLMVTMTESWTGLCWLQHGFHDHRPDIRPPPRRKEHSASQWNFCELSFERLTSCGHSHENHKYVYVYIHICVYLGRCKEIPIHQSNFQVSAALPCFHCPS